MSAASMVSEAAAPPAIRPSQACAAWSWAASLPAAWTLSPATERDQHEAEKR